MVRNITPQKADKSEKIRVAAYCRVSTLQEEQTGSIVLQEISFKNMIAERPDWDNAGVYSDRASGLNLNDRPAFDELMRSCRQNQVDLIITKSISRFGRNTLDMLRALQELQRLNVDVFFEEQNMWLHEHHLQYLLTIYCAFAQAESENMSKNIKWGVRRGFENGTSGYANFTCFGYERDSNGMLVVNTKNAQIVRRIFEMRAEGKSLGAISEWLYENQIPTPRGKSHWSREAISKVLKNEKYTGDVLLQKTFVEDLFTGKQVENEGELARYLISDHHPAIISRELYKRVNGVNINGDTSFI